MEMSQMTITQIKCSQIELDLIGHILQTVIDDGDYYYESIPVDDFREAGINVCCPNMLETCDAFLFILIEK